VGIVRSVRRSITSRLQAGACLKRVPLERTRNQLKVIAYVVGKELRTSLGHGMDSHKMAHISNHLESSPLSIKLGKNDHVLQTRPK